MSNRTPTGLKLPASRRRSDESGKATAKHGNHHRNDPLLGVDSGKEAFDRHAALLDDSRSYRSGNGIRSAIIVRKLQRDYGTGYVQQLIENISRRRPTRIQAKSATTPG